MTARHKGLGRGLDALLGGTTRSHDQETLAQLPVRAIGRGRNQPRARVDEASLADFADSIRARGVIQPIVVRPVNDSEYEILAGERRWRAAKIANLERIPAVIREVPDEAALGIGLIENIQREDLNPIEEASGLKRLIDEFSLQQEEGARALGRSRTGVTNLLRLLELAPAVQALVQDGSIDMGHARPLLALSKARQLELAHQIVEKGLPVRETERLGQEGSPAPKAGHRAVGRLDPDSRRLQEELSEPLGAQVRLKPRRGGRGSLLIEYASLDQLHGLITH